MRQLDVGKGSTNDWRRVAEELAEGETAIVTYTIWDFQSTSQSTELFHATRRADRLYVLERAEGEVSLYCLRLWERGTWQFPRPFAQAARTIAELFPVEVTMEVLL